MRPLWYLGAALVVHRVGAHIAPAVYPTKNIALVMAFFVFPRMFEAFRLSRMVKMLEMTDA